MRYITIPLMALALYASPVLSDDAAKADCKCNEKCVENCHNKKGEKCDCPCGCAKTGHCEHGKCDHHGKEGKKTKK